MNDNDAHAQADNEQRATGPTTENFIVVAKAAGNAAKQVSSNDCSAEFRSLRQSI